MSMRSAVSVVIRSEAYHDDHSLDPMRKGFVAASLPIVRRSGLLAEHHGGPMGEEVYWSQRHGWDC